METVRRVSIRTTNRVLTALSTLIIPSFKAGFQHKAVDFTAFQIFSLINKYKKGVLFILNKRKNGENGGKKKKIEQEGEAKSPSILLYFY